ALMHHRQREAGIDAAAIDQDGAGAALAVVAALLGAGKVEMIAKGVEKAGARIKIERAVLSVHGEGKSHVRPREMGVHSPMPRPWLTFLIRCRLAFSLAHSIFGFSERRSLFLSPIEYGLLLLNIKHVR